MTEMTETKKIKVQPFTVKDGRVLSITGEWWTQEQLLLAVKDKILTEPEYYLQSEWGDTSDDTWLKGCKTLLCIGGWCEVLTTGRCSIGFVDLDISEFLRGEQQWPWLFEASWLKRAPIVGINPTAQEGAVAIDIFIAEMKPRWNQAPA